MGTSTVNLSSADVEFAPPSSGGSQTPSLSSSDVEVEGASQQQGPVNPYANQQPAQDWRDSVHTVPLDTKQTGVSWLDTGINTVRNAAVGAVTPLLHPIKSAENAGQAIVASDMAPGGMYPTTAPTGNQERDQQNQQIQQEAQRQQTAQGKWMREHPGQSIPAAVGGVVGGYLLGRGMGMLGETGTAESAAEGAEGAAEPPSAGEVPPARPQPPAGTPRWIRRWWRSC